MTDLLGRRRELDALVGLVTSATLKGQTTVAVVSGEAGIGKTRLLSELRNRVCTDDQLNHILVGYGQALATSLASESYSAIRECLRSLVDSAAGSAHVGLSSRVRDTLRETAPDWLAAIPVFGGLMAAGVHSSLVMGRRVENQIPDVPPLEQLTRFIEKIAAKNPLLLVFDDLHWADPASIDLLITLSLKVKGPITIVLAYREEDTRSRRLGASDHPIRRGVLQLQRYRDDCLILELEPLTIGEISQLVRSTVGEHAAETFIADIAERSVGNPLFAESLIRVGPADSLPQLKVSDSRVIMSVLEDGLTHLAPADIQLLETAATIGFTFELDYLASLVRMAADELCDHLDILMSERQLLEEASRRDDRDRYTFHHPLLAEVLRERAKSHSARWRRTNRHLVEILVGDEPDENAWEESLLVRAVSYAVEAEQDMQAFRWASQAGRRQFAVGAITKARTMAEVAITHAPSSLSRFQARQLLVMCLTAEADHESAVRECDRAMADLDPMASLHEVYELKLVMARSLRMINEWGRMSNLIDVLQADSAFMGAPQRAAASMMLRAEAYLCGPQQQLDAAERTLTSILDLPLEPELRSRVLGHLGLTALAAYDVATAEIWLTKAIETAENYHHPYAKYEAVHWLSKKALACLELDRAESLIRELIQVSDGSGVAAEAPFHLRDLSRTFGLKGQVEASAEIFCRYFDIVGEESVERALTTFLCQVSEIDTVCGELAAGQFLTAIERTADSVVIDPLRKEALQNVVWRIEMQPRSYLHLEKFATEVLGLGPTEVSAAEAIYRFDVPSLSILRVQLPVPND